MYFPLRYSKNIEKQLLWYLLTIILISKRFENVLDVGCGFGQNIRFIRFKKYIGIDIDKKRIEKNKKLFKSNKVSFKYKDLFDNKMFNKNFDLIILIQVLTNSLFKKDEVEIALINLFKISKGTFLFNTSNKNIKDIKKIDEMLNKKNIKFKKIKYGIPSKILKIKMPIISQIISLFYLLIIFASNEILGNGKILYICKTN